MVSQPEALGEACNALSEHLRKVDGEGGATISAQYLLDNVCLLSHNSKHRKFIEQYLCKAA